MTDDWKLRGGGDGSNRVRGEEELDDRKMGLWGQYRNKKESYQWLKRGVAVAGMWRR